jgi:hypothetical protein
MNTRLAICLLLSVMLAAPLVATAGSDDASTVVKPGTPQAGQVMTRLEQARHFDQMNSKAYTAEDSEAGVFYARKSQEIDSLLKRLQQGEVVPLDEVQSALDNSHAGRYGGSF